jgi:hypothetical protein
VWGHDEGPGAAVAEFIGLLEEPRRKA